MDGLNECRTARVAEVLGDFRTLQYHIAAAPTLPHNADDYYTEGWAALRQCAIDGQHILNCAADVSVPTASGPEEQAKAELKQVLLDAYGRRHEAQKIYLRQAAARRWVERRNAIRQRGPPGAGTQAPLRAIDHQLRLELIVITDNRIYSELRNNDMGMGRWVDEDPGLRQVQRWVRSRRS